MRAQQDCAPTSKNICGVVYSHRIFVEGPRAFIWSVRCHLSRHCYKDRWHMLWPVSIFIPTIETSFLMNLARYLGFTLCISLPVVVSAGEAGPPTPTREPVVRVVDLNVGEMREVRLAN